MLDRTGKLGDSYPIQLSCWTGDQPLSFIFKDTFNVTLTACQAGSYFNDVGKCEQCETGFYSLTGVECLPCPDGARCKAMTPTGESTGVAVPSALAGWRRVTSIGTDVHKMEFVPCVVHEACIGYPDGNEGCADGYGGMMCSTCNAGKVVHWFCSGFCYMCVPLVL